MTYGWDSSRDRRVKLPGNGFQNFRGDVAGWSRHTVMVRVVRIRKDQLADLAGRRIPRNHVQVDVAVLILEKRVVEVVGRKSLSQPLRRLHQALLKIGPLGVRELVDPHFMPHEDQQAFTEQVLIPIQPDVPVAGPRGTTAAEDWSVQRSAQWAVKHPLIVRPDRQHVAALSARSNSLASIAPARQHDAACSAFSPSLHCAEPRGVIAHLASPARHVVRKEALSCLNI